MEKEKIRIEKLWKSFDEKEVLRGVDLLVPEGASMVIMGGSGVGKSVLLKHVIGLLHPDSGSVYVEGQDICSLTEKAMNDIRTHFGMSFQEGALFDSMTVFENIAFPLKRKKDRDEEALRDRVQECLNIVNLRGIEERYPSELSGGMKRRVGFARAISLEPDILLFDEPTTGLDPVMTSVIAHTIRKLTRGEKVTSITITHDLAAARIIGDRIAMLHGGKIIADHTPEQFMVVEDPVVKQFVTADMEGPLTEELL